MTHWVYVRPIADDFVWHVAVQTVHDGSAAFVCGLTLIFAELQSV